MRPRIGFAACFFHADPTRAIFKGKTLLYLEESMARWVQSQGASVVLIPTHANPGEMADFLGDLDGLLLQAGSDCSPLSYGETPLKPEWSGDRVRDVYEMELIQACLKADKPILGICRGLQILNVACGGSLYQDIQMQVPGSLVHRKWEVYDQLFHEVTFEPGSTLEKLYGSKGPFKINTIHHQGIQRLGNDLIVEARSPKDQIIEAVRLKSDRYAMAVQWHPEFHDAKDSSLLNSAPLLKDFLDAVKKRKA